METSPHKFNVSVENPGLVFRWVHFQQQVTDYFDQKNEVSKGEYDSSLIYHLGNPLTNYFIGSYIPLGSIDLNDAALSELKSGLFLAPEVHSYRIMTSLKRPLPEMKPNFYRDLDVREKRDQDIKILSLSEFKAPLAEAFKKARLDISSSLRVTNRYRFLDFGGSGIEADTSFKLSSDVERCLWNYEASQSGLTNRNQAEFEARYSQYARLLEIVIQTIYQQIGITPGADINYILKPPDFTVPQVMAMQRKLKRQAIEFWQKQIIDKAEYFDMTLEDSPKSKPIGFQ